MSGFQNDFPTLGGEAPGQGSQNLQGGQQNEEGKVDLNEAQQTFGDVKKVKEFVPKGKMAKTEEQFMGLDALAQGAGGKNKKKVAKMNAVNQNIQQEEEVDQARGKPSQFFMMLPANPTMPADPQYNPLIVTQEQQAFVVQYFPAYIYNPADIIAWLFSVAQEREFKEQEDEYYNQQVNDLQGAPFHGGRPTGEDDYDLEEDRGLGNKRRDKKGKAAADQKEQQEKAERDRKKQEEKKKVVQAPKPKVIKDLKIEEDKNLVEVDTTRDPASLVFIGHVDAGKSTICGSIMYYMDVVDRRTIEKFQQEAKETGRDSWWLAYVMDDSKEEKAKGKTVEVGRALFNTQSKRYTIFDAPGHKNYVPNMIMGAACADIGGLVISARKGEFEAGFDREGQTREHAQLAISLGIQKLVVIVNKMDDPSVKWSKDRFDEIKDRLFPFLVECGYDIEKDVVLVPISGLQGHNVVDRTNAPKWWSGPSLIETLDQVELLNRNAQGQMRVPILDKMRDRGPIIFGKVESGTLRNGDKLSIMPQNMPVQVVNIYNGKDEAVPYALPGENIKVKLYGVEDDENINRGDVLCPREPLMPASELLECELQVLELLEYKPILSKGYQCIIHIHTVSEEATLKDIVVAWEKDDKGEVTEKKAPKFTKSGAKIICRITTRIPIAMEKFETVPQLGKFTLRDQGKTIAIGKILKYKPAKVLDYQLYQEEQKRKKEAEEAAKLASGDTQKEDVVFNMETGETAKAEKPMDAIAEGEEGEDDE